MTRKKQNQKQKQKKLVDANQTKIVSNIYRVKRQNTICLGMIVKNESKVIERCLNSVAPLIDYWVISDTGSTDGTQDIIKNFFKKLNIPGELHEDPWINFGHNRTNYMKYAKDKTDYLITLDADEIFVYDSNFEIPKLAHDHYNIMTVYGDIKYIRCQLFNNKLAWVWEGVLHEYPTLDKSVRESICLTSSNLEGIINRPSPEGARSSDPNKYKRDALVFETDLLNDPNNARTVFYLAYFI